MFMIFLNDMTDNIIPVDQRSEFLADGSHYLAVAIHKLAEAGGIPLEEKQKAGEQAIVLARKALELHTQLSGTESSTVAADMGVLSGVLDYFNDIDDDEILRRREQSIAIYSRMEGSFSPNVAISEFNLGATYGRIADRAWDDKDLDRQLANRELALQHLREAARIYSAINFVEDAENALRIAAQIEECIRKIRIPKATTAAATILT